MCTYVGSQGESRIEATKNRLELLEKIISSLRAGTSDQANEILNGIRSNQDLASVLDGMVADSASKTLSPSQADSSAGQPSDVATSLGSLRLSSTSSSSPATSTRTPVAQIDLQEHAYLTGSHQQPHARHPLATTEDVVPSALIIPGTTRIALPEAEHVSRAIDGFYHCSGNLFHVFSEAQTRALYDTIYNQPDGFLNASTSEICSLMAVAAVGAEYDNSDYAHQARPIFYDLTKYYFDNLVQSQSLDAVKVCTLLSVRNIMSKATVALAYLGTTLTTPWY
jgi:hypothetical protein